MVDPNLNKMLDEAKFESQRLPDEIATLVTQFTQQFDAANDLLPRLRSNPDLLERYNEALGDMGMTARTLRMKIDLQRHFEDVIDRLTDRVL